MSGCVVAVEEPYKLFHSFVGVEDLLAGTAFFVFLPVVGKGYGDAFVEVGQFAQAVLQYLILVHRLGEYAAIGFEGDGCTRVVGFADDFDAVERLAAEYSCI